MVHNSHIPKHFTTFVKTCAVKDDTVLVTIPFLTPAVLSFNVLYRTKLATRTKNSYIGL